MQLSARALNRATLDRQRLLDRTADDPLAVLGTLVGLQAQQPASPYVALWNRCKAFDPAVLDNAYRNGAVLKASLLRITLHAVLAEDHPTFHAAMQPTLRARLNDKRYRSEGRPPEAAHDTLVALLPFLREPRTNADVKAWLTDHLGEPADWMWWAQRTYGPILHAPTDDPWSFGPRPAHIAAPTPPPPVDDDHSAAALPALVTRYLGAFGPASVADIAQFTLTQRSRIRGAIATIDAAGTPLVRHTGPTGGELFDLSDATVPDESTPAPPRLLGMWDNTLLAYADRSRIIPEELRAQVIRRNGDTLPTLLVDGHVAGVWRTVDGRVEATALRPIDAAIWDALDEEADSLAELFAGREPDPYRRYDSWWAKGLPSVEVRLLGQAGP